MSDIEDVYNGKEFYVQRLFDYGLLPNALADYSKRLFYFIDFKNVYMGGANIREGNKPNSKLTGSHIFSDRIGHAIIEILVHIIFDNKWHRNDGSQISILDVINESFEQTYISLSFFTQNPGNYSLDSYALGLITDYGWVAELFKYVVDCGINNKYKTCNFST